MRENFGKSVETCVFAKEFANYFCSSIIICLTLHIERYILHTIGYLPIGAHNANRIRNRNANHH